MKFCIGIYTKNEVKYKTYFDEILYWHLHRKLSEVPTIYRNYGIVAASYVRSSILSLTL